MTADIDRTRIKREVGNYYRYATFSHKWEDNEPLFEKVIKVVVHDLEEFPTHAKLQMFCKIVREAGFNWAWSDTCCINKGDHFIFQEALVSMFKWYEGSSLTIIFLRGVHHLSEHGTLSKSIWNERAWTLQEYHASKVVRFYTEDWTPYLNLDIPNHKESPEIISEMERATGISAGALMELRPGLDGIREKLCLASRRKTTYVEDAAYSLLGIFSVSLPVVYGEGNKALGKLLAQLLASSGDTSILAWTGRSGSFNSCLPANILVFSQSLTSHIPPALADAEMESVASGLRASLPDLALVTKLYDRLQELPVPSFSGQRMRFPCLAFTVGALSPIRNGSERVFRARATALGVVEIKTREDLTCLGSLCLIHPWINFLLDQGVVRRITETTLEAEIDESSVFDELPSFADSSDTTSEALQTRLPHLVTHLEEHFGESPTPCDDDTASLPSPSFLSPVEKQTQALRFMARLRQPFGALLLAQTRQRSKEYRRVAAESLITVQVEAITLVTLDKLIKSVQVLDVL